MSSLDFLVDIVITLGVGGLVGVEREARREGEPVYAGVRTFPLLALAGLLTLRLGEATGGGGVVLAVGLLVVGVLAIALLLIRHLSGTTGFTTPAAMVVTFLAGALIGAGLRLEGVVVGVATTFLLLTKQRLHGVAAHLTEGEVMGALQFVTLAFILFPLAPDEAVDPWGILRLRWLLLIIVFVSSISFVSLLAMRAVGTRTGIEASGMLGGLVNSEAASASIATLVVGRPELASAARAGILLATGTMLVRNLVVAAFADPSLAVVRYMTPAVGPMLAAAALAAILVHRPAARAEPAPEIHLSNPFAIAPALRFAAVFAIVSAVAFVLERRLGDVGVYAASLGSFVSAGAVIASVSALAIGGKVSVEAAGQTAVLACLVGVANKFIVLRATNRDVLRRAAIPLAATLAVGLAAFAVVLLTGTRI